MRKSSQASGALASKAKAAVDISVVPRKTLPRNISFTIGTIKAKKHYQNLTLTDHRQERLPI